MTDRNTESHFGHIESPNIKRSMFDMQFRNLSTCNAGKIIPFFVYSDVLPGDTLKVTTSAVIRMQTPLNPTMDDLFVDTYYFAIPHRLVWDHWKEFMGENKDSAWVSSTQYQVPKITAPSGGVTMGTIADYMGIPKGIAGIEYQALPFRAYTLVYDTWFRNQNLIAPPQLHTDDTDRTGDNTVAELGGTPFSAGRIADYFSTCLPEAQKQLPGFASGGVTIPLGTTAPVKTSETDTITGNQTAIHFRMSQNGLPAVGKKLLTTSSTGSGNPTFVGTSGNQTMDGNSELYISNQYADLTNATAATINALRLAFQIQKLFESMGRGGTRYFELIKNEFATSPNIGYMQYPEYLGGKRTPLDLSQVLQNSSTTGSGQSLQALGDTGGMSHTVFSNEDFTKSFQEHCIVLGVMVIRQYHTYQQGLNRMWSRRDRLDYYTPVLAHLGEQAVLKKEIMATGTASADNAVFGYQERWSEYKYGQQIITGEMNSTYATSLDVWHYGDYYANQPTLAQNWFEETPAYIDRTIAVTSSNAHQFKFDIATHMIATRPMPVYCTPGLIDHF